MLFLSIPFAYDAFGIGINGPNLLQSATFYKKNLYYGTDFLRYSTKFAADIKTDYDTGSDDYEASDGELSVNLLMPRLGYRMPFKSTGSIKSYNQFEGYLIIPMLKSSGDLKLTGDLHEEIVDALSLMGFKISHCVEYSFTEQLALAGEVGLNWIFWDYKSEYEYEDFYYTETTKSELNIQLGMTYTKLSLLFKF